MKARHVEFSDQQKTILASRLMRKATRTDTGCLEWSGAKDSSGYGKIQLRGIYNTINVPRTAFAVFVGPVPADRFVCHKCDNPSCFEPSHLFLGTGKDNADDAIRKNRMPQIFRERCGNKNPNVKLSDEAIPRVLACINAGESGRAIAQREGVSPQLISMIKHGYRSFHQITRT